jgi:hypothetical protein
MSSAPDPTPKDPAAALMREQLAALAELRDQAMVLARAIPADGRAETVLAFTRIARCVRLTIYMEQALYAGRLGVQARGAGDASLAADADLDNETDGDEAAADARGESESGSERDRERMVETEDFGRWLNRPLDEVIAHIRRQLALSARTVAPAETERRLEAVGAIAEAPAGFAAVRDDRPARAPPTGFAARPKPP